MNSGQIGEEQAIYVTEVTYPCSTDWARIAVEGNSFSSQQATALGTGHSGWSTASRRGDEEVHSNGSSYQLKSLASRIKGIHHALTADELAKMLRVSWITFSDAPSRRIISRLER